MRLDPIHYSRKLTCSSYYLCEKTDGMRYLLYLTLGDNNEEVQFLIDRKNEYWGVPPNGLHLPIPNDHEGYHTRTLIDGELVMDKEPNGTLQPRFMVFDCMVLDGNNLMNRTLDKRLAYFREQIDKPYRALIKQYPDEKQYQHFLVEMKAFQMGYGTEMMFKQVLASLPHGNDGLIFTCRNTPYKHGTDPNILKWKPADENSIDFRLSLEFPLYQPTKADIAEGITQPYRDYDAIPVCNLLVYMGNGVEDTWYGTLYMDTALWNELKALKEPLDDRIVECYMDDKQRWRYMRFRDDKTTANHTSTVNSVIESIKDRVTQEDLIAAAKGIRDAWKRREAEQLEMQNQMANSAKRKAEEQGGGRPSPNPPGQRN